jgi:hypothetical protein
VWRQRWTCRAAMCERRPRAGASSVQRRRLTRDARRRKSWPTRNWPCKDTQVRLGCRWCPLATTACWGCVW